MVTMSCALLLLAPSPAQTADNLGRPVNAWYVSVVRVTRAPAYEAIYGPATAPMLPVSRTDEIVAVTLEVVNRSQAATAPVVFEPDEKILHRGSFDGLVTYLEGRSGRKAYVDRWDVRRDQTVIENGEALSRLAEAVPPQGKTKVIAVGAFEKGDIVERIAFYRSVMVEPGKPPRLDHVASIALPSPFPSSRR